MDIKSARSSRIARYGIALGSALHAAWRGLVWLVVPGVVDGRPLRGGR